MAAAEPLRFEAVLEVLEAVHAAEPQPAGEGLRERKKRQLRQRISNVATALFLVNGFDAVTVARIAAACEVSEQTVFNYFPTKESMFFDRSGTMVTGLASALVERRREPLVAVVRAELNPRPWDHWSSIDEKQALQMFQRFCTVAEESSTLGSTRSAEVGPFTDAVAAALAERTGTDPADPEVVLAGLVIAGLFQVGMRSVFGHVHRVTSVAALDEAVRSDVDRALRLAAPTLDAFDALPERG